MKRAHDADPYEATKLALDNFFEQHRPFSAEEFQHESTKLLTMYRQEFEDAYPAQQAYKKAHELGGLHAWLETEAELFFHGYYVNYVKAFLKQFGVEECFDFGGSITEAIQDEQQRCGHYTALSPSNLKQIMHNLFDAATTFKIAVGEDDGDMVDAGREMCTTAFMEVAYVEHLCRRLWKNLDNRMKLTKITHSKIHSSVEARLNIARNKGKQPKTQDDFKYLTEFSPSKAIKGLPFIMDSKWGAGTAYRTLRKFICTVARNVGSFVSEVSHNTFWEAARSCLPITLEPCAHLLSKHKLMIMRDFLKEYPIRTNTYPRPSKSPKTTFGLSTTWSLRMPRPRTCRELGVLLSLGTAVPHGTYGSTLTFFRLLRRQLTLPQRKRLKGEDHLFKRWVQCDPPEPSLTTPVTPACLLPHRRWCKFDGKWAFRFACGQCMAMQKNNEDMSLI